MNSDLAWIREKAAATLCAGQVERTLATLAERWPAEETELRETIEQFPLGEAALLHLVAFSSTCAARLAQDPQVLLWLRHPDVCASTRTRRRMLADLARATATTTVAAENFRALRMWKGRETLRIALREIAEVTSLEETTAELSQVAEICVAKVLEHWDAELRRRLGSPEAEFAVLALGKLGGRELNHSSDIDVIFLYGAEGQVTPNLSYHQWFNRLATKVFEAFAANDLAGTLFRMDLRLRPEGTAGPIARSLASLENYYAGFGETWERLALIKARFIAGDQELAYDFLREHQPFIFPRSPTPELLDEIAAIKRRIERDIVGYDHLERNVKLGTGGIREIEFVVQALQLLHGARQPFLQETSTLKALPALAALELLPRAEANDLEEAYRFLRRVEHRLQIEAEQQTHTVPEDAEAVRLLALSLSFVSGEDFLRELREQTARVRAVFWRVVSERPQDKEKPTGGLENFSDRESAAKALAGLAQGRGTFHVAPRTRQIFQKLRPMLLEHLGNAVDADATLTQFVRFVEAYGMRSLLFELLVANPRLLELVVKTLDASRSASDLLIRRPQLLEEVTRPGVLDRTISVERHIAALRASGARADNLDPVRAYRQLQSLRILVRDVLGLIDLAALQREHSAIAEACLVFVHSLVAKGDDLTIVALGKFGGRELSYGADLDVLFVGANTRGAQEIIVEMARSTAEGAISPLDARLRPDGEKGPITCSLAAYERYYRTRAQLWELQSLTRARLLCGSLGAEFLELAQSAWRTAGQRQDLFPQIDAMRERIRRDRGSGAEILDFKTGLGGMIEAEFLVQALQMRAGLWNPTFAFAVVDLQQAGVLSPADAGALRASYDFLRRCESILRRWENKSVACLPQDEGEQWKLAKRMEAKDLNTFGEHYRGARGSIHAVYSRHLRNA
ncbi:MAG: bifunctional [glutamate--ammonia ligase]-adenylyl-L-tyrosine phosphorylase/[glutamate--ammonia-ligase] adenylyltransferase [Verrucomicrobiota bacterium]|nr:bifunctional [glutamate--ammonia ligase]-adenylyl-L-tyrosine phosphorylase/[glutamate--ammonia-ligase] adenylyltransferase [Verrucomicrobiota bacterium]